LTKFNTKKGKNMKQVSLPEVTSVTLAPRNVSPWDGLLSQMNVGQGFERVSASSMQSIRQAASRVGKHVSFQTIETRQTSGGNTVPEPSNRGRKNKAD
jgi:hypothetical protein